jgi:hypothetical protein
MGLADYSMLLTGAPPVPRERKSGVRVARISKPAMGVRNSVLRKDAPGSFASTGANRQSESCGSDYSGTPASQ